MFKRKLGIVVLITAVVIALIVTLLQWNSVENENERRETLPPVMASSSELPTAATSTSLSSAPVSPPPVVTTIASATTSTSEVLAPTPVVEPPTPPALEPVVPAAPTALRIHEPEVDIDAIVADMPFSKKLEPPSCSTSPDPNCKVTAHWVSDQLGTAPGYPTDNSTYILGHAWAEDDRVFNALSQRLMQYGEGSLKGYKVTLETPNGILVYEISDVVSPRKQAISQENAVWDAVPNRLVLIMCALDRDFNYIVLANLIEAHPR